MVCIEIVEDTKKILDEITPEKMIAERRGHVIFMTPQTFCKVFTPERLKLLMFINKNKIMSISDLARKVGRKFEAVHRDLTYLQGFSVVKVRKNDACRVPYLDGNIEMRMVKA